MLLSATHIARSHIVFVSVHDPCVFKIAYVVTQAGIPFTLSLRNQIVHIVLGNSVLFYGSRKTHEDGGNN